MSNNILRVTHTDLDGVGPVVLDKLHNIPFDDILMLNYTWQVDQVTMDYVKTFKKIIFTDMSPLEDYFHELIDLGIYVIIYDHHESSSWCADLPKSDKYKIYHDQTKSGTKIYFEEFILKQFPRVKKSERYFVNLVDTYDLWKKDDPLWDDATNATRVMYKMKGWDDKGYADFEKFIDQQVKKIRRLSEWRWLDGEKKYIEQAIEKEKEALEEGKSRIVKRVDSKGNTFGTFHLSSKISLTATKILELNLDIKYLVIQSSFRGLNSGISFRSRDEEEFNCLDLHMANGHKSAAGGEFKNNTEAASFLEGDIYCFTYEDEFEETGELYHYL